MNGGMDEEIRKIIQDELESEGSGSCTNNVYSGNCLLSKFEKSSKSIKIYPENFMPTMIIKDIMLTKRALYEVYVHKDMDFYTILQFYRILNEILDKNINSATLQ